MDIPRKIPTPYEEGYLRGRQDATADIFEELARLIVLHHQFNDTIIYASMDFEKLKEPRKKYTEGE